MYDAIIIGRGPAGISAALYTQRANIKTLIIGKYDSPLIKTDKIENYYGFSKPITGKFLLDEGEEQAKRLGIEIIDEEVIAIEKDQYFRVITIKGEYVAKAVLLATGQKQKSLKIEGLSDFEGKGVSYCTTCDGFFYRNAKVGIVGRKDFAIHEMREMEVFTKDITLFTNGEKLEISNENKELLQRIKVVNDKIIKLEGAEFLENVILENGVKEELAGLFIANESASSIDFARKLGVLCEGNSVITDNYQRTNLEGLFAAGDCTGGFKQISTAVGQGSMAGKAIIEYIRNK